jgi:hypothetical protein
MREDSHSESFIRAQLKALETIDLQRAEDEATRMSRERLRLEFPVFSLATKNTEALHWKEYAADFTGLCIHFDATSFAQWIGMPARFVAEVSGHSTRVGAAQHLAALDIDLAAITQAGGWKSPRMPLQYAEKINAARSGMARAAAASGRDKPVSE